MKETSLSRFETFVEPYYRTVFRFAVRLCGDPVAAMVYAQRTFQLAHKRSRDLPVPANMRSWLLAILLNQFIGKYPRNQFSRLSSPPLA